MEEPAGGESAAGWLENLQTDTAASATPAAITR
jgi:hypothetical protein